MLTSRMMVNCRLPTKRSSCAVIETANRVSRGVLKPGLTLYIDPSSSTILFSPKTFFHDFVLSAPFSVFFLRGEAGIK